MALKHFQNIAKIDDKNEVNPTFMAEERMWLWKRNRQSLWKSWGTAVRNQRQTCGGSYLLSHKMSSKKFGNCCCYHNVHCRTYRSGVCKKTSYVNSWPQRVLRGKNWFLSYFGNLVRNLFKMNLETSQHRFVSHSLRSKNFTINFCWNPTLLMKP